MDIESDDDGFYGPASAADDHGKSSEVRMEDADEGEEEEGEEVEGDDDDSDDVNFITDAKEAPKPESTVQPKRPSAITQPPQDTRKASVTPSPAIKAESTPDPRASTQPSNDKPGTDYPARHTSKLDPNGNPVHPTTGKPILSTDFDVDFPSESTKPWRKPGSDITDYFNYGFDEFTWASYCLKQLQMPKEIKEINAQAEQMKAFVEGIPGGGVPGMPSVPTGPAAASAMPGMPSEAEMQQMFQGMMAQGMDPSSMDSNQFMQMMMGGGGSAQGFPQGQGFGGGAGQPPQQPQMGFNADSGGYQQGGGGNFGGRGRGRGRRGNWG